MTNAAVLWTGGKDSALALYEAKQKGYNILYLVTFVPEQPNFLAHPLSLIKLQSEAIGIPHKQITIRKPYKESYEQAILSLKKDYGIDTLVTGDIAEIAGNPNWIKECSKKPKVNALTPLWHQDREYILNYLISKKFKIIFSCLKKPWFKEDSQTWQSI